ncbi:ImmA/IrrE family metallo-endopeptidase, partial [Methyloglobulus morosus]|uniref:ImmA/IrrE family metallo-endopeptidase n=1 Tax=Methyloglobulus morosus TaxID=1410681 RepID=UPI00128F0B01
WFTLMHELSHIALHLNENNPCFFDDLDPNNQLDALENEADTMALEALIPKKIWISSNITSISTKSDLKQFADNLSIHHAIVAGRIRSESKNYRTFRSLLGQGEVRKLYVYNSSKTIRKKSIPSTFRVGVNQ